MASDDFRDAAGRFRPGCPPGPGRPRGKSLRAIAAERAPGDGIDVDGELWGVARMLLEKAKDGDIAAAKVVLDKFAPDWLDRLDLGVIEPVNITVVTGVPEPDVEIPSAGSRPRSSYVVRTGIGDVEIDA